MRSLKLLTLATLFLFSLNAFALSSRISFFYYTDSLKGSSTTSRNDLYFDLDALMNLNKKGDYQLGWSYGSITVTEKNTDSPVFSLTEMGPKFLYYFNKDHTWSLALTYNLQTNATYKDDSTASSKWRGTSIKASMGFTPMISEDFIYAGIYLNYYQASFAERVVGETSLSKVSYTRGIIYPSIIFAFQFN